MKHFITMVVSSLLIVSFCFADVTIVKEESQSYTLDSNVKYVPGRIVLKLKEGVSPLSTTVKKGVLRTGVAALDLLSQKFMVSAIEKEFFGTTPPPRDSQLPDLSRFYIVKFDRSVDLKEVLEAYAQNPLVEVAAPIGIHRAHGTPNDPSFSNQWHLDQSRNRDVDGPEAWDTQAGNTNGILAIVDSGVLYSHPDLGGSSPYTNGNIWTNWTEYNGTPGVDDDENGYVDDIRGWDWVDGITGPYEPYCTSLMDDDYLVEDNDPSDYNGHGTHCAGIAAAMTNNGVGVAGVAGGWYPSQRGCQIMCLRVAWSEYCPVFGGEVAWTTMEFAAKAFRYAADMGATAINFSYGSSQSPDIEAAIDYAVAKGVIITKSAGNSNEEACDYIACRSDVMTVASTDQYDKKSSFSDYGTWVDVSAPGSSIYSTYSNHYSAAYVYASGTSMAAPVVAGLCGLLKSQNPTWDRDEIVPAIVNYTESIDCWNPGYEGKLGTGRVNAFNSLDGTIKNYVCEQTTNKGTVTSGGIDDTRASDDVYEAVTEEEQPKTGNPKNRRSVLEKVWTFEVAGGTSVTFHLEAHHSANSENDHFDFEYSTNGIDYSYITTVDQTYDVVHVVSLPSSVSGTVSIRVTDTDQTNGNRALDTIYIDHMFIESEPGPAVPDVIYNSHTVADGGNGILDPGETSNLIVTLENIGGAAATNVAATLSTTDSYITINDNSGTYGDILSGSTADNTADPYNVTAAPGTPNGHVVEFYLNISADGGYTNVDTFYLTVGQQTMHVNSIDMSLELTKTAGPHRFYEATATVTIVDAGDSPIEGAMVYGQWSRQTSDSDSGPTDVNGQVALTSDEAKNPTDWFKFCVTDVTKDGWVYDPDTNVETCDSIKVEGSAKVTADIIPTFFSLSQNYPNPFNPETDISFAIPTDCKVTLEVYNLLGQKVETLVEGKQSAGVYTIRWNAVDVPSGVYFYRITAGEYTAANKMILMK